MKRGLARIWAHLACDARDVRRLVPDESLRRIEQAVSEGERGHSAEIRIAIEASLPWHRVARRVEPRERALEVFSELRVWDTEGNNGVLIYVLMADRDVEIVADRAIAARVPQPEWDAVCREMEDHFRAGRFAEGSEAGVAGIGRLLAGHFPGGAGDRDEQPDRAVLL